MTDLNITVKGKSHTAIAEYLSTSPELVKKAIEHGAMTYQMVKDCILLLQAEQKMPPSAADIAKGNQNAEAIEFPDAASSYQFLEDVLSAHGIKVTRRSAQFPIAVAQVMSAIEGQRLALEARVNSFEAGAKAFGLDQTPPHAVVRHFISRSNYERTRCGKLPEFGDKMSRKWEKVNCPACRKAGEAELAADEEFDDTAEEDTDPRND